jgi:ABC-2 type transport system permease protein
MLADVLTVMWKESKGLFRQPGSRIRATLNLVIPFAMLGIYGPLTGRDWMASPFAVVLSSLMTILLVVTVIPDSFAGERERHTLATLLATRLSDRAILFGKLGIAVLYGFTVTIAGLIAGVVTANIAHRDAGFVFYSPGVAVACVVMSLLVACLMACGGALISLRSATVQGATQTLMAIMFTPLLILQVLGVLLMSLAPQRRIVIETAESLDPTFVFVVWVALLLFLDLFLLALAISRFQRSRIIAA